MFIVRCRCVWIALSAIWCVLTVPACEQRPIEPGMETASIRWNVVHEFERIQPLFAVWVVSPNHIIAGTSKELPINDYWEEGQSAMYTYEGGEWSSMDFTGSEISYGLSIWGRGADDIFAADGMLHHFDGTMWTETDIPAFVVAGNEDGDVFAVTEEGIYRHEGQDWQIFYEKAGEPYPPRAIWVGPGPTVAVAWHVEIVLWDGNQWRTQELYGVNDLWGTSIDDLYAVGMKPNLFASDGIIWHFDGNGWSPVSLEYSVPYLYGVWGSAPDDVYAVGQVGTILHYDGLDWMEVEKSTVEDLFDIYGSGPNDVYAVGRANRALRYDGSMWRYITEVEPEGARLIWAESSTRMIVVNDHKNYFLLEDGKWVEKFISPVPAYTNINAIDGSGITDLYAAAYSSIYHFDGIEWTLSADSLASITSFYVAALNDVFAVGRGTIYRFDGSRWNIMMKGTFPWFNAVWGSSADNVFAVGGNGVILRFDGQNWNVQASYLGYRFNDVWGTSANDVYAVGNAGILHFDGEKWSPQSGFGRRSMRWIAGLSANNVVAADYDVLYHFDGYMWRRDDSINDRIILLTTSADGSVVLVTDNAIRFYTE